MMWVVVVWRALPPLLFVIDSAYAECENFSSHTQETNKCFNFTSNYAYPRVIFLREVSGRSSWSEFCLLEQIFKAKASGVRRQDRKATTLCDR